MAKTRKRTKNYQKSKRKKIDRNIPNFEKMTNIDRKKIYKYKKGQKKIERKN